MLSVPRRRTLLIAVGGALGAICRWAALQRWPVTGGSFPWTVFAINVVGSFVVGLALAEEWSHPRWDPILRDGVGVGFCGGLTTMSTFAVETTLLAKGGHWAVAAVYTISSVAVALGAALAGARVGRRVLALTLPLEGPDSEDLR